MDAKTIAELMFANRDKWTTISRHYFDLRPAAIHFAELCAAAGYVVRREYKTVIVTKPE